MALVAVKIVVVSHRLAISSAQSAGLSELARLPTGLDRIQLASEGILWPETWSKEVPEAAGNTRWHAR